MSKQIFENVKITGPQGLRDNRLTLVLEGYDQDLVNLYGIDRILTCLKLWDPSNWDAEIETSYYGEEVTDIFLLRESWNSLLGNLHKYMSLESLKDKVEYLLLLEYGSVSKFLENKTYQIIDVPKESLIFGQSQHYQNVIDKYLPFYSDKSYLKNSIRGLAYKNQDKWRVLDGYHRLVSTSQDTVKIIAAS